MRFSTVTYSLTSYSPEEHIAQEEILEGRHDVVVVVVDATALGRSLVLMAQVMLTGARPVLCLNMSDEAGRAGQQIDLAQMSERLGFPVVETIGHRSVGADQLLEAVWTAAHAPPSPPRLVLGEPLDRAIAAIRSELGERVFDSAIHGWVATKLLVGEKTFEEALKTHPEGGRALDEARRQRERIESQTGMDIALFVTERFFGFVDGLLREVVRQPPRADARAWSDRIDSVVVHRILGLPIFAGVMYVIFFFTFTLGEAPMNWIESGFEALADWISI